MKPNDLNTALYEKMAAEQDKYWGWLKSQPPAEVLNHAYEYTVREDSVMAMEELELTGPPITQISNAKRPLKRRCGNTLTGCISATTLPGV